MNKKFMGAALVVNFAIVGACGALQLKMQSEMTTMLKQIAKELDTSASYLDKTVETLPVSRKLYEKNVRGKTMMDKTIQGMKLTTELTVQVLGMQEQGVQDLRRTLRIARQTKKELQKLDAYTGKLFALGLKTAKQSDFFYDFAKFSYGAAKDSLALAKDSLLIVSGEKEPPPKVEKEKKKEK